MGYVVDTTLWPLYPPVPFVQEAGWTPEPVGMGMENRMSFLNQSWNPGPSSPQSVATLIRHSCYSNVKFESSLLICFKITPVNLSSLISVFFFFGFHF